MEKIALRTAATLMWLFCWGNYAMAVVFLYIVVDYGIATGEWLDGIGGFFLMIVFVFGFLRTVGRHKELDSEPAQQ